MVNSRLYGIRSGSRAKRAEQTKSRDTFPMEHNARPYDRADALYCILHIAMYFIVLYCIGGIQQLNPYRSNNVYKLYVIVCERE